MNARVGASPFDSSSGGGLGGGHAIMLPSAGRSQYILREWRASPEPYSTSLVFGVAYLNDQTVNDDPSDAFARIRFGTSSKLGEDDCQVVDVDLFSGLGITVLGNHLLSVELIYGPLLSVVGGAVQPALVVDLSISHGANAQNARRTVKVGTIAPNASSARFPIPNQAREAILVNDVLAVTALEMTQFLTLNGPVISDDALGKKIDSTVLYAHGATFFVLTTGAAASTNTAVVWKLNL